mmetsp:Transcript_17514/g.37891  ORF Transcript_17514/g.37891 Transcript_17514/m.37891 type:complete len:551 (+) Transcript_17514:104-1756(+)|eukprot:CAMPEP_0172318532 /NCGR_PEP_ID=MMETSP1058-20130122/35143_1 /TAXON_ID=83371 /ORGANISM="Detonula confervacea, Strain CCMP 353" /LENGTH=550 /DNA_ID=CAMNT_0013033383 /DNA_START=24 /DNA_END=1676 /DNA_ORIENTATION=+
MLSNILMLRCIRISSIIGISVFFLLQCSCSANAFLSPPPSANNPYYISIPTALLLQRHSCYQDDNVGQKNGIDTTTNLKQKYSAIRKGHVYFEHNFLAPDEITAIRNDIHRLRQQQSVDSNQFFKPSGLSNRVKGDDNTFGSSDRLTCTLHGDNTIVSTVLGCKMENLKHELEASLSANGHRDQEGETIIGKDKDGENNMSQQSPQLELELEEMYYSISPKGSSLPRHNDERHEDTKGEKGWITDTRRSISWLIYLNEDDWGSGSEDYGEGGNKNEDTRSGKGGELRAYCRKCRSDANVQCGSHEGNIQVGWLREAKVEQLRPRQWEKEHQRDTNNPAHPSLLNNEDQFEFEPIFLDSWVKMPATDIAIDADADEVNDTEDSLQWQAMSALYRIKRNNTHSLGGSLPAAATGERGEEEREYLSKPFGPNSPSWPSETNLEPADFAQALAAQLFSSFEYNETNLLDYHDGHDQSKNGESLQSRFVGTEDIHILNQPSMMTVVDVIPAGGTLVLFDSVAVPHEVLGVKGGERLAIAGWFHERQQDFPDWYGT